MTNAGLFLMGVRLYNPAPGRFLQVDPVPGGSPSAYTYPTDPILIFDLSGTDWTNWASDFLSRASILIWMASALTPCTAVCVGLGLVVGVASVSLDAYHKDKTALALDSVGLLTGGLSATAGKLASRAARDASGIKRITKIVHGRVYQKVTRIIKIADHASNGTNFGYYMYSQWQQIKPRKR